MSPAILTRAGQDISHFVLGDAMVVNVRHLYLRVNVKSYLHNPLGSTPPPTMADNGLRVCEVPKAFGRTKYATKPISGAVALGKGIMQIPVALWVQGSGAPVP